jgi:hypothetical protein
MMNYSCRTIILRALLILSWPAAALADAGFKDKFTHPVSEITVGKRSVISRCLDGRITGIREEAVEPEAYFIADGITAPALRVRIVNQSLNTGSAATTPYTDREYDNQRTGTSEVIRFVAGTQYRGSAFVVAAGRINRFGYSVYDRNTRVSVETGTFEVNVTETVFPDREIISDDFSCRLNPLPPIPLPPIPFPPHPIVR